jgi:threonine synthase
LATGEYETRGVVATTSPSMDIQVSSNFERLLFEACGRDAKPVAALMASLAQSRRFTVPAAALKAMRTLFTADRADEQECAATIRTWMREAGYCADPHTAVGLAVAEKEARDPSVPMVVLSTAHPAKFPDAVKAACGISPALPDWLADLPSRPERVRVLPADRAAVERSVLSASRAAREGAAA